MFGFLKRPAAAARVQIIRRDPLRLTLAEFRSSAELTQQARRALADPFVRQLLDVARTEHLAHYLSLGQSSLKERAMQHARAEGYGMALNNLEAMGQYVEPAEALTETFEPPETEAE